MPRLRALQELAKIIQSSACRKGLGDALSHASRTMGFGFYALSHHPQSWCRWESDLRIHNYPSEWETSYDRRRLGIADPIHRASRVNASGFCWGAVGSIIPITRRDRAMLSEARSFGIHDGFTVPANVPGEQYGSVTFATGNDAPLPLEMLIAAEALGHMAFQTARVIDGRRPAFTLPRVTDRQLEIVVLLGQDKTDGEMAQILGVKKDTIAKHVRNICDRLEAVKRTSVPLRAVFAGLLCFSDILS